MKSAYMVNTKARYNVYTIYLILNNNNNNNNNKYIYKGWQSTDELFLSIN